MTQTTSLLSKILRSKCFWILVPLFVVAPRVMSSLSSNVGWVHLNENVSKSTVASSALRFFDLAMSMDRKNGSAIKGAGFAHAIGDSEQDAHELWLETGADGEHLISYGNLMSREGFVDAAFVYFRGADKADPVTQYLGRQLAGRLCQINRIDESRISPYNQGYCVEYFRENGNNMLINGEFHRDISTSWRATPAVQGNGQASLGVDTTTGLPAPSLRLSGLADGSPVGLFQSVALSASSQLRFSGYFRGEGPVNEEVRLLYIEWMEGAKTHGTSLYISDLGPEWQYFERVWELPDGSESSVQFYPILFSGNSRIWVDNVKVEIIRE